MKNYLYVLLCLAILFGISGCSEDDNNTEPQILGYLLEQFVDQNVIHDLTDPADDDSLDFRGLYNYEIVAADGYSPRNRVTTAGYDLDWLVFKTGYKVPADENSTVFLDETTPGAFEVKEASSIRLYRRIVVQDTLGNSYYKELHALPIHSVPNWDGVNEDAIKLSDMLTGVNGYTMILLESIDGFARSYTPEQIDDGYFLLDSERTTFPTFNATMTNSLKKFKYVNKMVLDIDLSASNGQYTNADSTTTDLSIQFPEHYDSYNSTVIDLTDN